MTTAIKQTMINTFTKKIEKATKTQLPRGFKVAGCEGWSQHWKGRNGETIEFRLSISTPVGQATYNSAQMLLDTIESVMAEHQVQGVVHPQYDRPNDLLTYRCCL